MDLAFWLKVLKFIIELLLEGMSKDSAVAQAASYFNVSEKTIWNRLDYEFFGSRYGATSFPAVFF